MKKSTISLFVGVIGFVAGGALGADYTWSSGTGDWLDSGWSPSNPVWDSSANAHITGGTMNLTPSSRPTSKIHNVVMAPSGGSATLNISGDLHGQNFEFSGSGGSATINQTAGAVDMDGWMYLGSDGSAANTYNLNGGSWNAKGRKFYLGAFNSANMAVNVNGGHLTSTYSGTSSILYLGGYDNAVGNLNLNSGSVEVSLEEMSIGHANSARGTLTQTGGYFKFDGSKTLYLGRWDNTVGTMNISGGTNEIDAGANSGIRLGYASGAKGEINLSGGLLDYNATYFIVGQSGTGVVNQTGGRFELPTLVLANNADGTGTYTISGGELVLSSYIEIKHAGSTFIVDGSGADSIQTDWLWGHDGILRFNLDANGVTPIEVGDDGVILTNMTLEINALSGFDGQAGDVYDLVRTSGDMLTTGLAITNKTSANLDWDIAQAGGSNILRVVVVPEFYATNSPLRVVSYNIRRGLGTDDTTDIGRTGDVLEPLLPDFVALSEVDSNAVRSANVDQAKVLGDRLGMEHRFYKTLDKDSGNYFQKGAYGEALLSRFHIDNTIYHDLPHQTDEEPRVAIEIEVQVPDIYGNQQTVSFISTHLAHENEAARNAQSQALVDDLENVNHPIILAGDLNSYPDSQAISNFTAAGFIVSDEQLGLTFNSTNPTEKIDFVLTRGLPVWHSSRAKVIDEELASDHRPLLVPVTVGQPSAQWLGDYGLPSSILESFTDPDGDGADNYSEWKAGTNPTNALSFFGFQAGSGPVATGFQLQWNSITDRTYRVERSTNLVDGVFQTLESGVQGLEGTTEFIDTNAVGNPQVYYRVHVE